MASPENREMHSIRMSVVRRYDTVDARDLSERLRFVFAPWIDVVYNSVAENDPDEVSNEEGGCDNTCVNSQTIEGDKS